jgi:hypothetical protein
VRRGSDRVRRGLDGCGVAKVWVRRGSDRVQRGSDRVRRGLDGCGVARVWVRCGSDACGVARMGAAWLSWVRRGSDWVVRNSDRGAACLR